VRNYLGCPRPPATAPVQSWCGTAGARLLLPAFTGPGERRTLFAERPCVGRLRKQEEMRGSPLDPLRTVADGSTLRRKSCSAAAGASAVDDVPSAPAPIVGVARYLRHLV
jgi:hypothetical protein